jgi:hypothetical protein
MEPNVDLMPGEMVAFILFSSSAFEPKKDLLDLLRPFGFLSSSSKFMAVLSRLYAGREGERPSQSR